MVLIENEWERLTGRSFVLERRRRSFGGSVVASGVFWAASGRRWTSSKVGINAATALRGRRDGAMVLVLGSGKQRTGSLGLLLVTPRLCVRWS